MVSEEQDQSQVSGQPQQTPAKAAGSRSKSKAKEAREQAISPKQSIWPFALACALVVLLIGFIIHLIVVLGIGVVLVVAAIIGWGLERR